MDFDGANLKLLNPESASHSISISPSNKFLVDNMSRPNRAPRSILRDTMGNKIMDLETLDLTRLREAGWRMPRMFTVKAADGITDLYGIMWRPFDFDPQKKYAVIDYCYPGPQTEGPRFNFSPTDRNVPLAQLGFVVISVGNRGGSPLRSNFYHTFSYGNARDYGLEDQKFAIEQLASRHSFIDIERVGIYGHSGGGFMSTAAILMYPDFFKVAVSSAGNHDNNIYNQSWGEFHYGVKMIKKEQQTDKSNDTGAAVEEEQQFEIEWETNITHNPEVAQNLKGHLLLVHGDNDNNVHPANTIRVADALIKAGKRFDFMIMPGKAHGFGDYQRYFDQMKFDYFCEHLLGASNKGVNIYEIDK